MEEVQKKLIGDNTLVVESVSEDQYAYQTLNEEAKQVYDAIVYTIQNHESEVQIATTDVALMELAYQAVRYDYCEFFWVDQLNYVTYTRMMRLQPLRSPLPIRCRRRRQTRFSSRSTRKCSGCCRGRLWTGAILTRRFIVYETLIREVDYVLGSENNQNIISVFLNHETICQGYAYATQYLLERLGIPCTTGDGDCPRGQTMPGI